MGENMSLTLLPDIDWHYPLGLLDDKSDIVVLDSDTKNSYNRELDRDLICFYNKPLTGFVVKNYSGNQYGISKYVNGMLESSTNPAIRECITHNHIIATFHYKWINAAGRMHRTSGPAYERWEKMTFGKFSFNTMSGEAVNQDILKKTIWYFNGVDRTTEFVTWARNNYIDVNHLTSEDIEIIKMKWE